MNIRSLEIVVILRLVIKKIFFLNELPLVLSCRKHIQTISGSSKAVSEKNNVARKLYQSTRKAMQFRDSFLRM